MRPALQTIPSTSADETLKRLDTAQAAVQHDDNDKSKAAAMGIAPTLLRFPSAGENRAAAKIRGSLADEARYLRRKAERA